MNEFSDHGFLKIKFKCHKTEEKVDNNNRNNIIYEQVGENLEMLQNNYTSKFKVREKSNETIFNSLNEEDLKRQIKELEDKLEIVSVSETVTTIRNILLKISKNCFDEIKFRTDDNTRQKRHNLAPWMDENCKRAKKELNIARKKYQELLKSKGSNDITNTDNLRMQYFEKRRMYHSVCKKTDNAFWRKKRLI